MNIKEPFLQRYTNKLLQHVGHREQIRQSRITIVSQYLLQHLKVEENITISSFMQRSGIQKSIVNNSIKQFSNIDRYQWINLFVRANILYVTSSNFINTIHFLFFISQEGCEILTILQAIFLAVNSWTTGIPTLTMVISRRILKPVVL